MPSPIASTSTQSLKYSLNIAGEFFVAAELQRRRIMASVTYGNAKAADVVAFCEFASTAVVIEVKTTSKQEWVVGSAMPESSEKLWVFVHLPPDEVAPPRYFVCTSADLYQVLLPRYNNYRTNYLKKHGKAFAGGSVETLTMTEALQFENQWQKIVSRVTATTD